MPYHHSPVNPADLPPSQESTGPLESGSLEKELLQLTPEQTDKLLGVLRGLFRCVGELNERLGDMEKRHRS
ncbi:MAG: hypothetical protein QM755_00450 [Luteolibacter sp.]